MVFDAHGAKIWWTWEVEARSAREGQTRHEETRVKATSQLNGWSTIRRGWALQLAAPKGSNTLIIIDVRA
jgi:hypothetical protein